MKRWEIYLDIIMELLVILAGALLLIFVLPKAIVFLWPFVAGWIISMMAHPVIEYLEKKVKLPKKFGSAILIAGSYHRNHSGSLFCSQRYRTAGHRIYTGCTRYPS